MPICGATSIERRPGGRVLRERTEYPDDDLRITRGQDAVDRVREPIFDGPDLRRALDACGGDREPDLPPIVLAGAHAP